MNNYISIIIGIIFIFPLSGFSQRIFSVDAEYKADIKVFVVDAEYKADLVVYKVKEAYQAGKNDGQWYFADAEYKADFTIFFVDAEYKSELKVFFADAAYKAGWKKRDKMHLLYWSVAEAEVLQ